jgi:hypothetical protein
MNPDFDPQAFIERFADFGRASGMLEAVNGAEPENAPSTSGVTSAIWVQRFGPVPTGSGLAATSARLVLNQRLYSTMQTDPLDAVDPAMLQVLTALQGAYHGAFDLTSVYAPGAWVDLLGQSGIIMDAQAAYMKQDDGTYRIYDLPIPIILNDIWEQIP